MTLSLNTMEGITYAYEELLTSKLGQYIHAIISNRTHSSTNILIMQLKACLLY